MPPSLLIFPSFTSIYQQSDDPSSKKATKKISFSRNLLFLLKVWTYHPFQVLKPLRILFKNFLSRSRIPGSNTLRWLTSPNTPKCSGTKIVKEISININNLTV